MAIRFSSYTFILKCRFALLERKEEEDLSFEPDLAKWEHLANIITN